MVYLDNAATTQPKYFAKDYAQYWLNSNTFYAYTEQRKLVEARKRIMKCLNVKSGKVLFCRCATEAATWFSSNVGGTACGKYEHESVFDVFDYDKDSQMLEHLNMSGGYTHQLVNQVTGKVFDIENIEKIIHKTDEWYYFGSDFTAAIGHAPLPKNLDSFCDAIWLSGHKFGSEKGIGAIWLSDRLFDCLDGSTDPKNNYNLLHGTLNVPAILAMADALEHATSFINSEQGQDHYRQLHDYLFTYAQHKSLHLIEKVAGCGAIVAVTVPFCEAQSLQNYLASKEIYVSTGNSACASAENFRILKAFDYTEEECGQTLRLSFNENSTCGDVEAFVNSVIEFKNKF